MTDDKNVPDFETQLENVKSPMGALALAYNNAPSQIVRDFINRKANELLFNELPKLAAIVSKTPAILTEDLKDKRSVTNVATKALENLRASDPDLAREITATIVDAATELAEVLDRGMRRILLDDKYASREAYMDVLSAHGTAVAAFVNLALNEEQTALAERGYDNEEHGDA